MSLNEVTSIPPFFVWMNHTVVFIRELLDLHITIVNLNVDIGDLLTDFDLD